MDAVCLEDIDLLISQADRCRLILKNIGTDPKQEDDFLQRVSLKNLLNEIVFSNERKHDKKIIIIDKKQISLKHIIFFLKIIVCR